MSRPAGVSLRLDLKEIVPGLFFIAFGGYFLVNALFFLGGRSEGGVGPAAFPILVSVPLIGIGIAILLRGLRPAAAPFHFIGLPKLVLILLSPILFGATARGLGMLPALILCIGCASFAEMRLSLRHRALIVAAITALCIAIFHYGLRLPYPLIGPWLVS